jgi:hypothetical protein
MPKNKEPTIAELVQACADTLDVDVLQQLRECDNVPEAIGEAYTALLDAGIEDPDAFLAERLIFEIS